MFSLKSFRAAALSLIGMGVVVLGACASGPASAQAQGATSLSDEYRLGSGDQIKVTVFGEPDLSGNFEVDGQGVISMSLIGEVPVKSMTLREVQREIETRLRAGFVREPQVSAEMTKGRPYYILGEVNRPGQYDFTAGLTVMNAVASAGDFTYRADKKKIFIKSANDTAEREVRLTVSTLVNPGDTIRVRERFF